ncbi:MAG: transporter substrate-binding protein [Acidimicrobiales bacterium]|nr:transporter substrate-binding protein [Acidimicrobiales bacterium]
MPRRSCPRPLLWLLALLAVATGLTACGSDSTTGNDASAATPSTAPAKPAGLTDIDVQLSWLPTAGFAGEYVADDSGYFKDEGLSVTLTPGGPNVLSIPTLLTGKALLTWSTPDSVIPAINEGAKIKIIGAVMQKAPYAITSRADNPIKTPQDLVGKTIGVQPNNTVTWQTFLKLNNIDPGSVKTVTAGFDPTPLAAGDVDGWMSYATDEPITLGLAGTKTEVMLLGDFGYESLGQALVVTDEALADPAKRASIVAYVKASMKGWTDVTTDVNPGAQLTVEKYGKELKIPLAQAQGYLEAMKPLITSGGGPLFTISKEHKQAIIDTMAAGGLKITSDELFTDEILDEANS